jgi:HEAT repeat protein
LHCLAELGAIPRYVAMHDASVIAVCVDALLDTDLEVRRWATRALAALVLDEKTNMQRFGKQVRSRLPTATPVHRNSPLTELLQILERLTSVFLACSKEDTAVREDALIALAGCVTLHKFSEQELGKDARLVISTVTF